jgi:hypothetical protein
MLCRSAIVVFPLSGDLVVNRRVSEPTVAGGVRFSQLERQRLQRLRYEGHDPASEEVNAA